MTQFDAAAQVGDWLLIQDPAAGPVMVHALTGERRPLSQAAAAPVLPVKRRRGRPPKVRPPADAPAPTPVNPPIVPARTAETEGERIAAEANYLKRESLELVRAWLRIKDGATRAGLLVMIHLLSSSGGKP